MYKENSGKDIKRGRHREGKDLICLLFRDSFIELNPKGWISFGEVDIFVNENYRKVHSMRYWGREIIIVHFLRYLAENFRCQLILFS